MITFRIAAAGGLTLFCIASAACSSEVADVETLEPVERTSAEVKKGGGGVDPKQECDDKYGDCYIDCSVRYPESKDSPQSLNEDLRGGCFDSCDAAHRLCSPERTTVGGKRVIEPVRGVRGVLRR